MALRRQPYLWPQITDGTQTSESNNLSDGSPTPTISETTITDGTQTEITTSSDDSRTSTQTTERFLTDGTQTETTVTSDGSPTPTISEDHNNRLELKLRQQPLLMALQRQPYL